MGPFVVIALPPPFLGHAPDLIQCVEDIAIQYLRTISTVKPLDISILRWFAGLNVCNTMFRRFAHSASNRLTNSGPLSIRNRFGLPRISISSSSALTIRAAGRLVSISMRSASRLKSSSTLNMRKRRPLHKASVMRSTDQALFGMDGAHQTVRGYAPAAAFCPGAAD